MRYLIQRYIGLMGVMLGLWVPSLMGMKAVVVGGVSSYPLKAIAGNLGMKYEWVVPERRVRLRSEWTELDFERNSRSFQLNGVKVYLGNAVSSWKNELWISELDYEKTLQPILTPQVVGGLPQLKRIVIDPGHGGKDPGTSNQGLKLVEKHLALDVARRLAKRLRGEGYEVLLTRDKDEFLELKDRALWANAQKADLFISVHFNAAESSKVSGVETFAYTPVGVPSSARGKLVASDNKVYPANGLDEWNLLVAYYVHRALLDELKVEDRGVKRARFGVLKYLECPGLLVESGFLSSGTEGRNIGSAAYRNRIVDAIDDGVAAYARTLERLARIKE